MTDELREALKLCGECPHPLTPHWVLILKTAEQVLKAKDELPEPYILYGSESDSFEAGINEGVSLCLPMLAKKNMRIRELEEEKEKRGKNDPRQGERI